MVKRVVIGRSGEEKIVDLVKALDSRAAAGNTRPSGDKVLDYGEDFYWTRPDGITQSMREVDEGLEQARDRIADAEVELEGAVLEAEQAKQLAEQTQADLDRVETEVIPGAVAELEQADAAAQQVLGELDTRLTSIDAVGTGELATIRDALTAAQDAVDAAQSVATEANKAANAASQAALEAAGIAASKGRVIVSETEPTGEDRKSSNIWIKPVPDDPDTEVEEKAVTYVYLEATDEWQPTTSSELAQAAQNALDAREAAQQAQQRADTAVANAATAQSAAEAAQRTADQATTDARDAHNEAVSAQERVQAKIDAGDSLVLNGGFESGDLGWPENGDHGGRSRIIESEDAHSGSHVLELTPDTANVYPMSDPFPVTEGHTYQVRMWYRYMPDDRASRICVYFHQRDNAGASVRNSYAADEAGRLILLYADDLVEDEWTLFSGLIEIVPGATWLTLGPHALGKSTDVFHIDDIQVVDVTEARKAQARADEAYTEAASKLDEDQVDAKITASANGKNSITRSTSAASGKGVVVGDLWVQVDSAGDAFRQWYWDGSAWKPAQIKSDMLEALDVHKLQVTGEAKMDSAVIDKLWVDGLSAKSVTTSRLVVAQDAESVAPFPGDWGSNSGNRFTTEGDKIRFSGGRSTSYDYRLTSPYVEVLDGTYQAELTVENLSETAEGRVRLGVYVGIDGTYARSIWPEDSEANVFIGPGETFTHRIVVDPEFTGSENSLQVAAYMGSGALAGDGYPPMLIHSGRLFRTERVGAVLIEPGAVTTPKLTVTEDMSASIVNSMTVNTKKLVVTEEAVLQHAKLLGTTIVEDINVTGKLIGKDGVFTGTVDFANVNVTGDVLASKISGEYLYGTVIEGGVIRNEDSGGGRVLLGDDTFIRPHAGFPGEGGLGGPGIGIELPKMGGYTAPPGLGPAGGSFVISGGSDSQGASWADLTSQFVALRWSDTANSAGSTIAAGRDSVSGSGFINLQAKGGSSRGDISVSRSQVGLSTTEGLSGGRVRSTLSEVALTSYSPNHSALIECSASGTSLQFSGASSAPAGITASGGRKVAIEADTLHTQGLVNMAWGGGAYLRLRVDGTGDQFACDAIYRRTSSAAANVSVTSYGTLRRMTSSRRYKKNIANWSPDPKAVLALQPRQWQDRQDVTEIDETWHVGFIAEEVDDLGLKKLVQYVGDGKGGWIPESLNYDRFAAAQQVVLQKHEAEIKELRERIALLESK